MTDQYDDRTSVEQRLNEALVREAAELLGDVSVAVENALRPAADRTRETHARTEFPGTA